VLTCLYTDQWENYFAHFPNVAETASTASNGATASTAALPYAHPINRLQASQAHGMNLFHRSGGNGYPYSAARDRRATRVDCMRFCIQRNFIKISFGGEVKLFLWSRVRCTILDDRKNEAICTLVPLIQEIFKHVYRDSSGLGMHIQLVY